SFRMGVLRADIERTVLKAALRSNGVVPIDGMAMLDATEVDAAANIVGQMGMSAFQRALAAGVDVVVAGRACDTATGGGRLSHRARAAHGQDHRMRVAVLRSWRTRFDPGNARSRGFRTRKHGAATPCDAGVGGGAQPLRAERSVHRAGTGRSTRS